jgi:hypothetical protein
MTGSHDLAIIPDAGALESWEGAAARGLARRQNREGIIKQVLVKDQDYGTIPGTKKPILFKAGAEKINDSLNLYPTFERIQVVEDWDRPLFHYAYRCTLRHRGTDIPIATGIGSCNSMEEKYRWRNLDRTCPTCGKSTVFKGKEERGGGWFCWKAKGGCGRTFNDGDATIEGQAVGKVLNEEIYSIVNTIDKMAQVRAMKGATRNLGFSDHFEDLDDDGAPVGEASGATPAAAAKTVEQPKRKDGAQAPPSWTGFITEITTKTGTKKNGQPWTLFEIHGDPDVLICTFDTKIADQAQAFRDTGEQVTIPFTITSQGGKNAVSIAAAPADESVPA